MTDRIASGLLALIVLVHLGLIVWAAIGLVEWFVPDPPWRRLSNPLFSRGMLMLQWSVVLGTASILVVGTLLRWPWAPYLLAAGYVAMASICAFQTFNILQHEGRFTSMALEYVAYIVVLALLFSVAPIRHHFAAGGG